MIMATKTVPHQAALLSGDKPPQTRQTPRASHAKAAALTSATLTPVTFTEITGQVPNRLTKIIGLNAEGGLRKETAANLSKGTAKRLAVNGLAALRDHLDGLTIAQAIAWGTTREPVVNLCTQADEAAIAAGSLARTRDNFQFPRSPGILMLDHDGLPSGAPPHLHPRAGRVFDTRSWQGLDRPPLGHPWRCLG
jgi:hypothetical protein